MSDDPLERVYAAKTDRELADAYSAWAAGYDRQTAAMGYCLPFLVGGWIARHVPQGDGPLLDAGCGTGLSGPALAALGYGDIEGLDMSDKMLAVARGRGAYGNLVAGKLGDALPWPDGHFAAVFSTGVFTEGHAPASALDEIVRITRPGGHVILTVRDTVLEAGGFASRFAEIEDAGLWRLVERSAPFRAFAIDEPEVLVCAFVFRIAAA